MISNKGEHHKFPDPPSPQFGQLGPLFPDVKNDVSRVWQKKITGDDNDLCLVNYGRNLGNFDDNGDNSYWKKT